jgi:hypothetical protein
MLLAGDPRLGSLFAVFTRLTREDAMPLAERAGAGPGRLLRAALARSRQRRRAGDRGCGQGVLEAMTGRGEAPGPGDWPITSNRRPRLLGHGTRSTAGFPFPGKACNVENELRPLASLPAKSAVTWQSPDFFMPWAAHARNCGQRITRVRGKIFFQGLAGRNDRFNAHVSHSGNQQGWIMRVISGIISRPGRRPLMSTVKQVT